MERDPLGNGQPDESLSCHQPASIPIRPRRGRTSRPRSRPGRDRGPAAARTCSGPVPGASAPAAPARGARARCARRRGRRSSCSAPARWSRARSSSPRSGSRGPRAGQLRRGRRGRGMYGKRVGDDPRELALEPRDLCLQRGARGALGGRPLQAPRRTVCERCTRAALTIATPGCARQDPLLRQDLRAAFYQRLRGADARSQRRSGSFQGAGSAPQRLLDDTASARPRPAPRTASARACRARGAWAGARAPRTAPRARAGVGHHQPPGRQQRRVAPGARAAPPRGSVRIPERPLERLARPAPRRARRCRSGRSAARRRAAPRWGSRRGSSAPARPPRSGSARRRDRGRCGGRRRGRRPARARAGC